ncbi:hypothetical protein LXA47_29470 [Massilia sp. P8910]|uniref:hypothetical protein n=1 Tax=Massilia antarctica TaxID=2765360 RepID=UPI001E5F0AC6|nr:hypothetical protein [Massilia antarctica]MCE3607699.1 hypothetical protein [Massilia antarctica]
MHAFFRVSGMTLVCLATTASAQAQVQRRESLCSKEEKVAFSCRVGNKIASLCASADLSDTSGYVQYRYGTKNKVELLYPASTSHPRAYFRYGSNGYTGGSTAYYRFSNNDYDYIVYSGRGWKWLNEGVVVEKDGQRLASLKCKHEAIVPDHWGGMSSAGIPTVEGEGNQFDMP